MPFVSLATAPPPLCKLCAFYLPETQTCKTSIVALSKTTVYYNFAQSVRDNPKKCGPQGVHFVPKNMAREKKQHASDGVAARAHLEHREHGAVQRQD